jgi:UDP-glucose 4-epimerase
MKLLITGGCGFIGTHTVELAQAQGYEIRVLDLLEPKVRKPDIEYVKGSVLSEETCHIAVRGVDRVLHLAAYSRSGPSVSMWSECLNTNINGTINILAASQAENVSKFVYAGSSTFYGNRIGIQKVGDQGDFLNFYGLSKYMGEELTNQFGLHLGLNTTNLRYFNVFGIGQPTEGPYGLVMGIFARAKKLNQSVEIHGTGEQRRDFIHVEDVARANLAALNLESSGGTYNVGSGKNVSINDLAKMFDLETKHVEKRIGDAAITLADITKTIEDLEWIPEIELEKGIKDLIS